MAQSDFRYDNMPSAACFVIGSGKPAFGLHALTKSRSALLRGLPKRYVFEPHEHPVRNKAANHVGDRREAIADVRSATAQDVDLLEPLAGEDAETIMLDFVLPVGLGGRTIDERQFARADEPDRRKSSPAGWALKPPSPATWC
jgi:hypothetical protein